jgi:hypothetical protein
MRHVDGQKIDVSKSGGRHVCRWWRINLLTARGRMSIKLPTLRGPGHRPIGKCGVCTYLFSHRPWFLFMGSRRCAGPGWIRAQILGHHLSHGIQHWSHKMYGGILEFLSSSWDMTKVSKEFGISYRERRLQEIPPYKLMSISISQTLPPKVDPERPS